MAHRHKAQKKNVGGGTVVYSGKDSNVAKEAEHKLSKRGGKVHGVAGHHRVDRRARGGGVGADKHPFSSAHITPHTAGGAPHPHGLGKTHSGG